MTKYLYCIIVALGFLNTIDTNAQNKPQGARVKISGIVVEKNSGKPLESAIVSFVNLKNNRTTAGAMTNEKGIYEVDVIPGTYDVKFEFMSFKTQYIKNKTINNSENLEKIALQEDPSQLQEVIIRNDKTTVEIKLDKKIYNVGKDIMVKGGTVSDVLDNVPSVSVDVEGNVALRGNDNVKVLIDGRLSNAININDALKMIPADAIDKVEVITNPSARYDAEGGAGLINIILKKGKTKGLNGTLMANAGDPENYGINGTLNFKSENFNLFTNQGFAYRKNPGNASFDLRYLNNDNSTRNYIYEQRNNIQKNNTYNGNFGAEWFLDKTTTWTNTFNYRKNSGNGDNFISYQNFDANRIYKFSNFRNNIEDNSGNNIEFTSNLLKKFKKDGHKLTVDFSASKNNDDNLATIYNYQNNSSLTTQDTSKNKQRQNRNTIQADYVLPLQKQSQVEAGYRGNFTNLLTDYQVYNNGVLNNQFTNVLEYIENVNAVYGQFGTKVKKLSMLYGLRFEDSHIEVNQLTSQLYKTKKYNNFFPSATWAYEISDNTNVSFNYSKRINRPRGREINPFNSYSSNINIFQGNPDLNPSLTDAFDIGFLKKWDKLTLSTSLYYNTTKDVVQMIRRETGNFVITVVDGADVITNGVPVVINGGADVITPVMITTPINLAKEYRTGFEFTLNYSPYKWWKLNTNFNFFAINTSGSYAYTNYLNQTVAQNFDNKTNSWSSRVSSKISLPYKIDWQTNFTYNAPQTTAQGKILGIAALNLGFSKDVFKDKATIALNVNDVFNSRKRRMYNFVNGTLDSYQEMQFRVRQINLSFTYRFNKSKNDKDSKPKRDNEQENGGDIPG